MPYRVDAYMAEGVASGMVVRAGHLRDQLEQLPDLAMTAVSWQSLDGSPARAEGDVTLAVDDVLVVVADDDPILSAHAAWHSIQLEVGPYTVSGDLPTLPGFDPGRALTRPSGEFVMLRDVKLGLLDDLGETIDCHHAMINRYGVDRVSADLMLGFFFPGAAMDTPTPEEPKPEASDAGEIEAGAPEAAVDEPEAETA
jgi:hypothetical protein